VSHIEVLREEAYMLFYVRRPRLAVRTVLFFISCFVYMFLCKTTGFLTLFGLELPPVYHFSILVEVKF